MEKQPRHFSPSSRHPIPCSVSYLPFHSSLLAGGSLHFPPNDGPESTFEAPAHRPRHRRESSSILRSPDAHSPPLLIHHSRRVSSHCSHISTDKHHISLFPRLFSCPRFYQCYHQPSHHRSPPPLSPRWYPPLAPTFSPTFLPNARTHAFLKPAIIQAYC
jgi:hypothetical protein